MLQAVTIENAQADAERLSPLRPVGAVAALLARRIGRRDAPPLVYVAESARRRRDIAELMRIMAGFERVAEFAAPDGMPGDGLSASTAANGGRMSTLRWLLDRKKRPAVVLTTAAALIRRVPPRAAWKNAHIELKTGETIEPEELAAALARIGYRVDDRVDEPGEVAIRGRVVEIFPAAAPRPCRVEHDNGRITAIRSYDPATQRSVTQTAHLIVDPATEFLPVAAKTAAGSSTSKGEALLLPHYGRLETLLDYVCDVEIVIEDGAKSQANEVFDAIGELDTRTRGKVEADHLARAEWSALVGGRLAAVVEDAGPSAKVPVFALEADPHAAFARFVAPLVERGFRVVVAGPGRMEGRRIARQAARAAGLDMETAKSWAAARRAKPDRLLFLEAPVAEGFLAAEDRIAVVSLRDLAGQGVGRGAVAAEPDPFLRLDEAFGIGDAVVHLDHGVGILEGLEAIAGGAGETEALRVRYAGNDTLLVPVAEIGALWRYGGAASDVKLDRLKGKAWEKRRNAMVAAVANTAEGMVARLRTKEEARTPPLEPDRPAFERFCARFPYELTPDQAAATDAVLADLKSGRPMDRLVCGDVGFGKTEVALRAAAAAVFAGRQVAVAAPTTILAQQHFLLFQERFRRHGIAVVRLSRLADAAEIAAARTALGDGTARVVVGTHAILAEDVSIPDLALVVIDEEQRFGTEQKRRLRSLAADGHVLTMTATPIPRTLQAGFVGLHDVSVVSTPPRRRRPVRTVAGPFDEDAAAAALMAEKTRGGQSFVVCPRVEDLQSMAVRLRRLVPDLSLTVLHGRMDAEAADDAMLAFARGEGDVLLATSIVESGLDVPAANTMIVWRADRFGLAQLHQLRGRVGRGARRGFAMLATDPDETPTPGAAKRLRTLCDLTRLGAGFAIAAQDLDLRGTGELLGNEQAGHLQLVGLALYRRMLERALVVARGGAAPDDWRPDMNLGHPGGIPADYVPEAHLRIELAVLIERTPDALALDALRAEVADRFGPLPDATKQGFALAALRLRCRALGIRRLDAGSNGVAASFTPDVARALAKRLEPEKGGALRWSKARLVLAREPGQEARRLSGIETLLEIVEKARA